MRKVRLGEYIEQCDERNSQGKFDVSSVRGISINKVIIDTKADMTGVSLTPYKLLKPQEFAFVTITSRNGEKISLAENSTDQTFIVSSSYEVFRIKDKSKLLPDFLYLWFSCPEFDRYARFNSWGSAREAFSYAEMERVEIPLPSLDEQKAYVAAWQGLKELADNNAQMADPLFALCQSYLKDLKQKYPMQEIGPYITLFEKTNAEGKPYPVYGINKDKTFMPTVASVENVDKRKYKIVSNGIFLFSGMQTGRDKCIRIGLFSGYSPVIVSPAYTTFSIDESKGLLSEYFYSCFLRREMDRYGWFISDSSVRANLDWSRFLQIKIPLPPIEVQKAIVAIYRCAQENKAIAGEAAALSKSICPALMRQAMAGGAQ